MRCAVARISSKWMSSSPRMEEMWSSTIHIGRPYDRWVGPDSRSPLGKKIKTLDAGRLVWPGFCGTICPIAHGCHPPFQNAPDRATAQRGIRYRVEDRSKAAPDLWRIRWYLSCIEEQNFLEHVFIISFDAVALQEVRSAHQGACRRGFCIPKKATSRASPRRR